MTSMENASISLWLCDCIHACMRCISSSPNKRRKRASITVTWVWYIAIIIQYKTKKKKPTLKKQEERNDSRKKKSETKVCLLFWLKICSIIGAYFIPILVLKFQLKISVKKSSKTRGFLSLFILVFLLYSRAILSFSLSPSLLLCVFHCFNCWKIPENLSC